jgi:hypothetical protein
MITYTVLYSNGRDVVQWWLEALRSDKKIIFLYALVTSWSTWTSFGCFGSTHASHLAILLIWDEFRLMLHGLLSIRVNFDLILNFMPLSVLDAGEG